MEETLSFLPLLIVIFLAFLVPITLSRFRKLRLPIVVGEIIAGIIIGRSGFGLVQHHEVVLDLLAELGFVFLMFLSGMEIDFSSLGLFSSKKKSENQPASPIRLAAISFLLTLGLSILIGFAFTRAGLASSPWMIALILSTTSLGVVVPVLKEQGLSSGRYGQTLLIAALIADFATMLLITVVVAALSHGLTLDILLIGLLFVAFFLVYYFGGIFFNRIKGIRRVLEELSSATSQIKVRAAFTMMLIFVALAEMLGTEIILGAFLAGAIISLLKRPEDSELVHQLDAIGYGFFIPIFFIMVGVDFNLASLINSPSALLLVPYLLLAAAIVKLLPALVLKTSFSWRQTLAAGTLLSSRLSLIIAASAIGMRIGVISEPFNASIILVAIITVVIAPPLFVKMVPRDDLVEDPAIVVMGAGPLGLQVAQHVQGHGDPVIIIDEDPARIERAARSGLEAVQAATDRFDPLTEEILNKTNRLVCVFSDIEKNYRICERARTTFGIDHVVARLTAPGEISRFEKIGVTPLNPATDQAVLLGLIIRNPTMYELLTRSDDSRDLCEIAIRNPQYLNKPLKEIDFPGDMLVVAVRKKGELIVPRGDTILRMGDHLTVLGSNDCVGNTRELFG
ncbi:MAG: monovalent cation:proton antiporter family protein [Anaerolineales bacterium]|nr:monovalent cation:proton antiporter family protein [Anaerolineales bacterium]